MLQHVPQGGRLVMQAKVDMPKGSTHDVYKGGTGPSSARDGVEWFDTAEAFSAE